MTAVSAFSITRSIQNLIVAPVYRPRVSLVEA